MPATLTYPGVYIEEIPSGVRTISRAATSNVAFVGALPRGDTDRADLVQSFPEFQRKFGGLHLHSLVSYSVYHFFMNGGQQAYIVRLAAADAGTAEVTLDGKITVKARNPGDWAKQYGVKTSVQADDNARFGLQVFHIPPETGQEILEEAFEDLSLDPDDPRFAVNVMDAGSSIVKIELVGNPTTPPADTSTPQKLDGAPNLDGTVLVPNTAPFEVALQNGVTLLDTVDIFNLLCVPGENNPSQIQILQKFCHDHRAFLIVDCSQEDTFTTLENGPPSSMTGANSVNSAFYFPWVTAPNPLRENRSEAFPPCGFVAGLYAKTDTTRGVWKAPAGTDASLTGANGLKTRLTDLENGELNIRAVNCLRNLPVYGNVVWGARTLRGRNEIGSEWKYVPVRRVALFIEESLYRGTQWVVFEPNDEPLWAQIRLNIGAFMHGLFLQGAFQGRSAREAYFVKCDGETTTQNDINLGVVNILVGFAPLKPAEFVVIKIQQMAGQIAV
jgi:phage tail sheath protein FI